DAQHIEYRVEDRRVGVSADRYDDATEALAKLDLGPRAITDIRKRAQDSGLWDTLTARHERELSAQEEILEAMIGKLQGIASAYVTIHRASARGGLRPPAPATAFVYLET